MQASQGLHRSSALTPGLSLCESLCLCPNVDNKTSSQSFPIPSGSCPLAGILGSSGEVGGFKYVCSPKDERQMYPHKEEKRVMMWNVPFQQRQ